jgi:pantoate--beta-alanine ligase
VEVPDLSRIMCGLSRPTHFRGVCTVVLKLFMITQADVAVFGQKDWQQQAILRRMVRDLNVPVRIETCPIVREEDGLALSSRNVYLTEEERRQAPWIHRGLQLARDMAQKGQTHAKILREAALCTWADHLTLGRLDYLSVVDPVSMEPLDTVEGPALMACAIRMGKARLIDNILLRD